MQIFCGVTPDILMTRKTCTSKRVTYLQKVSDKYTFTVKPFITMYIFLRPGKTFIPYMYHQCFQMGVLYIHVTLLDKVHQTFIESGVWYYDSNVSFDL